MAAQDKVVLYPPGMETMAAQLCEALGVSTPVCTSQISTALSASPTLCWERFPSGDPNVKVRTDLRRLKRARCGWHGPIHFGAEGRAEPS